MQEIVGERVEQEAAGVRAEGVAREPISSEAAAVGDDEAGVGALGGVFAFGIVLLLYVASVVWLTWPLATHVASHLPDSCVSSRFDTLAFTWALAHESRALVTAPTQFANGNIYYPAPHALFYGETGFGMLPYFAPTFLITGNPVLALNVAFLLSVALTACVLHLVILRCTGSHLGGMVAAWTFLMTRWVLWAWAPCMPNYAVLAYFPFLILAAAQPASRFGTALWLLPLLVLQGLSSIYIAAALFAPFGLIAVERLLRPATRAAGLRLLIVLVLALGLLLPSFAGYLLVRAENPQLKTQSFYSFDVQTDLPWGPLSYCAPMGVPLASLLLILAGALSKALGARSSNRVRAAWAHGTFWAIAGLLISLTPTVRWHGNAINLPHVVLAKQLPIYELLRVPDRLGVAGLMGLTILAGLAFAECGRRVSSWFPDRRFSRMFRIIGRTVLAALIIAGMYGEYVRGPELPILSTVRTHTFFGKIPGFPSVMVPPGILIKPLLPRFYPLVEAVPDDSPLVRILQRPGGPLLELPIGPAEGGLPELQARAMYRSIFHRRPLLNGYDRYWPAGFPERMDLARRLPDPDALAELRRQTGLAMILVHSGELTAPELATWSVLAKAGASRGIRLVAHDNHDLLFAVGDSIGH